MTDRRIWHFQSCLFCTQPDFCAADCMPAVPQQQLEAYSIIIGHIPRLKRSLPKPARWRILGSRGARG